MMLGHALLAFVLVAAATTVLGASKHNAFLVAAVAGTYALLPDVDILYAISGLFQASGAHPVAAADAFWTASAATHRGVTHSLVTAVLSGIGFSLLFRNRIHQYAGGALLGGLVVASYVISGLLTAAVTAAFVLAGATAAIAASRRTTLSIQSFAAAVLFGLLSHPFGDLFTGTPPAFLYPFDVSLMTGRIVLAADPTLNLLSIFFLEIALAWAALGTALRLLDRPLLIYIHPIAAAGLLYTAAVVLVPAPTLRFSYPFVFSVLATGFLGITAASSRTRTPTFFGSIMAVGAGALHMRHADPDDVLPVLTTALATITVAFVAYTATYVLLV